MNSPKGPEFLEHDEEVGFQLIAADDIDELGVEGIIKLIRKRVGDTPVYLTYVEYLITGFLDLTKTTVLTLMCLVSLHKHCPTSVLSSRCSDPVYAPASK